jgi:hypothetical protein
MLLVTGVALWNRLLAVVLATEKTGIPLNAKELLGKNKT